MRATMKVRMQKMIHLKMTNEKISKTTVIDKITEEDQSRVSHFKLTENGPSATRR